MSARKATIIVALIREIEKIPAVAVTGTTDREDLLMFRKQRDSIVAVLENQRRQAFGLDAPSPPKHVTRSRR